MKTFIIHHERAHNTVVGVAALVLTIACGSTTDTVDGSTLDGGSLDGGSFDGGSGRPPGSYVPPIGIPAPGFGIDESHLMYEGASYDYGDGMEPYRTASDGPYTHYIDNTDVGCTNDSNPYGTSATPRCTLPKIYTLPAGSVVEIHGGPYDYGGFETILSNGTRPNPVYIRGVNTRDSRVRYVNTQLRLGGEYLIVENLELYSRSTVSVNRRWDDLGRSSNISIRDCEIHKPIGETGNSNGVSAGGDDIVVYRNDIHHNVRAATIDAHGVHVAIGSNRVWVLDNEIHHNSGNGIQACHRCDPAPRFVYIGRNLIHEDRELGIGLKYAEDVIISQNTIWGYFDTATATPTGIVVGADGSTVRAWIIYNEIYDSSNGVRIEETSTNTWVVGNLIHDIDGVGVNLEKNAITVYVVNNTFDTIGTGLNQSQRDDFVLEAHNNIFSNVAGYPINVEDAAVVTASGVSNNLFDQGGRPFDLRWGSTDTYTTTADLIGFPGGSENVAGNADYVPPSFAIGSESDAVGAGSSSTEAMAAYDQFETLYGIDIRVDYNRVPRPATGPWDIGAFIR